MLTSARSRSSHAADAELLTPLLAGLAEGESFDNVSPVPSAPRAMVKEEKRVNLPLTTDADSLPLVAASAPSVNPDSDDDNHMKSDPVRYLEPSITSFDEIKPNKWIIQAQTETSLLNWTQENKEDWIRQPNANTDREMMLAINGELPTQGALRSFTVAASIALSTPFTLGKYAHSSTRTINPGEIHFTKNAGKQEIRVEPGTHYLASLRHSWGAKKSASLDFIKDENITIVRIQPGNIGLATEAGKPIVLLPGRHAYNSALFKLEEKNIININTPVIEFGTLSFIRVLPNEIGLANDNGNAILLLPGLHIRNSTTFQYRSKLNTRELQQIEDKRPANAPSNYFAHGTISIVQVDKDKLGSGMLGSEPVLLKNGIHLINSRAFKFGQFFNANEQQIEFNTIHIIRVQKGQIGLAWDCSTNRALILPEGEHQYNSRFFRFHQFKSLSEKRITHGNYTRVQVNTGEYGYAWDHGRAVELAPGIHVKIDPLFVFSEFKNANEPVIQFGNIAHVIVKTGEARAVREAGKLRVLPAGIHNFDTATLDISPKPISLQAVIHTMHDIHVTTRDRMPMHVTGQVVYRVQDPEKLINGLNPDEAKELDKAIEKRAAANLREQFSHVDLSMISPDHHQHGEDKESDSRLYGNRSKNEGDDLRGQLCTKVMEKLSKDAEKWGIQILDFEMLDVGCQKKEVEDSLADATAKTRQAEAKYDLQIAENATTMIREKADLDRRLMGEKIKADISRIHNASETETAFLRIEQEAKAKARAREIETKAQADALLQQAEAEMRAAKLRAEGQKALNEAQLSLLNHPGYLELEKAKLQVQIELHRAKRSTPAVVFQGDGTRSADSMFFGEGNNLIKLALKQKGPYRTPPASPVAAEPVENPAAAAGVGEVKKI